MATTRNLAKWLCSTLLFLFVTASLPILAQPATFDGSKINIPAVVADGTIYAIELTLVNSSDPVTFNLSKADEASETDTNAASFLENNVLIIPAIQVGDSNLMVRLNLISDDPVRFQLADFSLNEYHNNGEEAQSIFEASIASQLVNTRCLLCHFDGGAATDSGLLFLPDGDAAANFERFRAFISSRSDSSDYILSKVSGGDAHGGGIQIASGSTDYANLQAFIAAVLGSEDVPTSQTIEFFSNVQPQSAQATLRRAAIILAGRAPTEQEITAVSDGDETSLKTVVRNLMQGENFHQFLLDGANDRLLVRGIQDDMILEGGGVFFNFLNPLYEIEKADFENGVQGTFTRARFVDGVDHGLEESPLELIAHVVENELPYSEILTADYMLLNPIANSAVGGTGVFESPENYNDFKPARIPKYYTWNSDTVMTTYAPTQSDWFVNPGSRFYEYPHAGVLNSFAYLMRYPSTATNRNRARARWTFYHFLDIDIERSAPRTTDPGALADTNNPTLFNQHCTVCHEQMDPVAAAFQDYADEHYYKNYGIDSLDPLYKSPDEGESLYQDGDTWYRDMRAAGLFSEAPPPDADTLQWLAQQIVADQGFARAAVKFWWPAVMGQEALLQPEVESDADYPARLMAYDAQSSAIQEMANTFSAGGMNLKDLLVDMVVSPWFSSAALSENVDPVQFQAHAIAGLGSERLLTAEQLGRKTRTLTGFGWNSRHNYLRDRMEFGLGVGETNSYGLYYGAIDSFSTTKRATDMTALMSTVATLHASESACPIVLKEFALNDGERMLFNGISDSVTPLSASGEQAIRTKLVELHDTLFGIQYAIDSADITDAYNLFVDSWNDVRSLPNAAQYSSLSQSFDLRCNWQRDIEIGIGLPISSPQTEYFFFQDFPTRIISTEANAFLFNAGDDPNFTKRAWVTVMFYMLSHYDYLYE